MSLLVVLVLSAPAIQAQQAELISRSDQTQASASGTSFGPRVSADGRFVVFESFAADVVVGQTDVNNTIDIFLRDRFVGTTVLVSHSSSLTTTATGTSSSPVISADGNYIVFVSDATDLGSGFTTGFYANVFLYERATGTITLVSHTSLTTTGGIPGSLNAVISGDGSYVVFMSFATNLGPGFTDANTDVDVFLYERATGTISLVSHAATSTTTTGDLGSSQAVLSRDGNYVAFMSSATNLGTGLSDMNGTPDVFLYTRTTGAITLVSHALLTTTTANSTSTAPAISDDGSYVAFASYGSDLGGSLGGPFTGVPDVFLYARATGAISLVSHGSPETASANGSSSFPAISGDGNFVAFESSADDLGGAGTFTDTNLGVDAFLWERATRTIFLVSHASTMTTAGSGINSPNAPAIDGTGDYVAFGSHADDLGGGFTDSNGSQDVFLYERATGTLSLASHVLGLPTTAGDSYGGNTIELSSNGQHVVFESLSSDLVVGDANANLDAFAYSHHCASTLASTAIGDNRIDLSWSAGVGPFAVKRSQVPGGPYTTLDSNVFGTAFSDTTAQGGTTYYYVVENVCGASNEASATASSCLLAPTFGGAASATAGAGGTCDVTVAWVAATSSCGGSVSYAVYRSTTSGFTPDASTRLASGLAGTSYLDTIAVQPSTPYYYVVRATADVNGQEDQNTLERSATTGPCAASATPALRVLDVRSGDTENEVLWVNPTGIGPGGLQTHLNYTSDGSAPTCPGTGGSTMALAGSPFGGTAGGRGSATHTGLTNGTKYRYAACVDDGGFVATSLAQLSSGRPDSASGNVKWAYTTEASALSPVGISADVSYQLTSNDRILRGVQPGIGGGSWLASPWLPFVTNAPVQGRPGVVTFPTTTVNGASRIVVLGSQDGHVYCLNAQTGAQLWVSPLLGDAVQAAPSGIFVDFGGAHDLILVGSRTPLGDSKFYGLNLGNGTIAWTFDNGGGVDGIGIINAAAQVDIANRRVYFTSRRGGSSDTVWALSFTATTVTKLWSADIGEVDSGAVLRSGKIYVGDIDGEVHVLDAMDGTPVWTTPYSTGDGAVKGLVWVDAATSHLYFSTNGQIHAVTDTGTSGSAFWSTPVSVPNPSPVMLIEGRVYVGGGSSKLYSIDATSATPAAPTTVTVGDPLVPKIVGSLAYDTRNGLFVVGTDLGVFFAVAGPF